MTSIKDPIERLRDYAEDRLMTFVLNRLDEIEAAYIKLPVDADGVPIRPGDTVMFGSAECVVTGIGNNCVCIGTEYDSSSCRHVKTDTVEGLLEEALDDAMMFDRHVGYFPSESEKTRLVNEYAERIRAVVDTSEERDKLRAEVKKLGEQLDRLRNDEGVA